MASSNSTNLGETIDLLTHPYRRYVLYYLRTHSGGVSIDTLTAMLTNELEGSSAMSGSDTAERVEIALHHMHLPKLADAGLITFSEDRESIELGEIHGYGQVIDQAARIDGYTPPATGD